MVLIRSVGAALAGAWLAVGAGPAAAQNAGAASTRSGYGYAGASAYRPFAEAGSAAQQQVRAGWIGIGLSCRNCRQNTSGKTVARWVFTTPPEIYSVDRGGPADRAGLRRGDTLLTIDGHPFVSAEGGEAFASIRPGVRIRLGYLRDGREREVSVTPTVSPTMRQLAERDSIVMRELARVYSEESERLRREFDRVQREVERTRGRPLTDSMLNRIRTALDAAKRSLRTPTPYVVSPPARTPATPLPTVPPVAPPQPVPPVTAWTYTGTPRLRYSGRVGNVGVEARRPGNVNVIEHGDTAVTLIGGDLTVRIAVEAARSAATGISASGSTIRTRAGDVAYGVTAYLVHQRLGEALGVDGGVLILSVEPRSHADSLGIEPGDVVLELNDQPAVAITPIRLTGRGQPGAATAVVVRNGERQVLTMPAGTPRTRGRVVTPTPRPTRPPVRSVPPVPVDTI